MARSPFRARSTVIGVLVLAALVATGCASDVGPQDYLSPEGPVARQADSLWDITFAIAVAIFFIVEGLIIYAIIRFRRRPGREPAQFHGNTKVEIALTAIPTLILIGLAVPTVKTIADLAQKPENTLDIKVVARQFWWEYEYLDSGVVTANEMHVPTGQPVFLALEGDDVIHSFWIPKLTGKQDVVPGRTNNMYFIADEPGEYYGQCTEFCGLSHANMRLRVIAHEPDEFEEWLADQQEPAQRPSDSLAREGERLFLEGTCVNCHAVQGTDAQARSGPDLTHFATRETFAGAMFKNNEGQLREWLRDPPAVKPGSLMPDYGLSEEEIDALIAYLYTLE